MNQVQILCNVIVSDINENKYVLCPDGRYDAISDETSDEPRFICKPSKLDSEIDDAIQLAYEQYGIRFIVTEIRHHSIRVKPRQQHENR